MVALNVNRRRQKLEDVHFVRREADLRRQFRDDLDRQATMRELARVTGIDDEPLLGRLAAAGFDGSDVMALSLVPLAFVAWASGSVSYEERDAALRAVYDSELAGRPAAIARFRRWLEERPAAELFPLWSDFVAARRDGDSGPQDPQDPPGDRLRRHAWSVASASGGIFGFGSVCSAERAVLDNIRAFPRATPGV